MASEEELFASVDALLEEEPHLPPPAERARLRESAGITQARLATALKTTTQSVKNWENGRSEPKSPRLDAYQRLLKGWAAKYPVHKTPAVTPASAPPLRPEPVVETFTDQAASQAPVKASDATAMPERPAARPVTSRLSAAKKAAQPAADPRFPHGPLAV
ncbi:helix-turn-helix domain-containing protein, partial [Streptomyces sp. SAS_260]|uniref:helix-turn-helix domain-containing protein n=1 Tax=Streptomyces sp. SAS_260 TaxID=3412751 RepID=UPI00403C44BB